MVRTFFLLGLLVLCLYADSTNAHPPPPLQAGMVVVLSTYPTLVIKVYPPATAYQDAHRHGRPCPEPIYYYRPGQDADAILIRYYPPVR